MNEQDKNSEETTETATRVFIRSTDMEAIAKLSDQVDLIALVVVALVGAVYAIVRKVEFLEDRINEFAK